MALARVLNRMALGLIRFSQVDEGTCQIVTRFGRFRRVLRPGLRSYLSCWGLLGRIYSFTVTDPATLKPLHTSVLNTKEIVFDYPEEKVVSRDNVQFQVDAIVYFRVIDPRLAVFGVDDYVGGLRNTVQSILRAELARHSLEECYANRLPISEALAGEADKIAKAWGIDVLRLEIQEFDLGRFSEQMLRQKEQEIEKRQEILHAEGLKEAKLREAEAQSQSEITLAEGRRVAAESEAAAIRIRAEAEAYAARVRAEAEAYTFQTVAEALAAQPEVLGNYLSLRTAAEISRNLAAGEATKIFLPFDVASLLKAFMNRG